MPLNKVKLDSIPDGEITAVKLHQSGATDGQAMVWSNANGQWQPGAGGGGGMADLVDDTSPQLGGDLDLFAKNIVGNGNIDINGHFHGLDIELETIEPTLQFKRLNNANVPAIKWLGQAGVEGANIKFDGTNGTANTLVFETYDSTTLAERFRINYDGVNVTGSLGVGTSTPDTELDVVGEISVSNANGQRNGLYTNTNGQLVFFRNNFANGTATMIIDDETGNVGIGGTPGSSSLFIYDSDYQQVEISGLRPTIWMTEDDGNANENFQLRVDGGKFLIQQQNDSQSNAQTRVAVTQAGYVGIGTDSPQRMLHIADGAATGLHITNDQSGHSGTEGFSQYIRDDNQDIEFVQRGNKRLVFYTNNTGLMAMKHDTATGSYPYISIGQDLSKADKMLHLYGVNPGVMVEGNSSGYTEGCFIQKCDDSYRGGGMYMYNGNGGSQDNEWFAGRVYASSADWRVCFKAGPSGVGQDTAQATYNKFRIYQNGNYYHSGSNVSDERIKQDIVAETDQLTNVLALKPKTFKFKPEEDINGVALEGAEPSNTKHGLIAQDVLEVLPNLVTGDLSNEDERLGVDYNALTSVLVKAMQEQQELIESLTARITTLESA